MARFDPTAATDAYLAALSPAAHAKATAYTQGGHWLLLWGALVTVLAAWIIARTGLLRWLKDRIERRKPRPNLTAFVLALVFLLLDFVLELPWNVYASWYREGEYGLTSQPLSGWLRDSSVSQAVTTPLVALFLMLVYVLLRRAPRTWVLWAAGLSAIGVVFMLVIGPVAIEPLLNTYTPAPPGPVRNAVVILAQRAGVPSDKIYVYNGSKQSNRYTANVAGLAGTARVAMSDTMFLHDSDIAEVRGVVGHEMGHYVHQHALILSLVLAVMLGFGLWLVARCFGVIDGMFATGAASIADPVGLPSAMALLAILGLIATPLFTTMTRLTEADADRFSLAVAHEPDGLSKALVATIEYRAASPSALEEFLFYDHPSVRHRVQAAMAWKAAHPDLVAQQQAEDAGYVGASTGAP